MYFLFVEDLFAGPEPLTPRKEGPTVSNVLETRCLIFLIAVL